MDRSLLNRAVTADETPTPAYIIKDLITATHKDLESCKQLVDFLVTKLQSDNAHVKSKVLKLMRLICEGDCNAEFRRGVQRRTDDIKLCTSYRGAPDPLRGDALNKMVRDDANACLNSLFALENSGTTSSSLYRRSSSQVMQGFGSTSLATNAASSSRPQIGTASEMSSYLQSGAQSVFRKLKTTAFERFSGQGNQTVAGNFNSLDSGRAKDDTETWKPPTVPQLRDEIYDDGFARPKIDSEIFPPSQTNLENFVLKCKDGDFQEISENLMKRIRSPRSSWKVAATAFYEIEYLHVAGLEEIISYLIDLGLQEDLRRAVGNFQLKIKAEYLLRVLPFTEENQLVAEMIDFKGEGKSPKNCSKRNSETVDLLDLSPDGRKDEISERTSQFSFISKTK